MVAKRDQTIRVEGIRNLARALKNISGEASKELSQDLKRIADVVATRTRAKFPVVDGDARSSVRARAVTGGASIAMGGARARHAPWLDYGGSTKVGGGRKRVNRPFVQDGRYLYPTLREEEAAITEAALRAMDEAARRNGLDGRGV